jgi:F-type H+-transporting ATPase subunit b
MKKLLIAALLATPVYAFAQEAAPAADQQPPAADQAPPAADQAPTPAPHEETPAGEAHPEQATGEHAAEAHAEHGGAHGNVDPTKEFNWASDWFSYSKKDVYGGKLGDGQMTDPHTGQPVIDAHTGKPAEEEPMSAPFAFMLLNFGILLIILAKFGGPVARKMAKDRHDQIKTALDDAAKLREQAAQKLAEYETRIKDVDDEVKKLVDGIRADAEADKKRILEAAATQAALMKRDAELRIAAEIELARTQLSREVAAAAAGATEKLLKEKVTGDDQNKLVNTFLTNVQSSRKEAR